VESVTVVTEPLLHPDFVQFEVVVPILERLRGQYDLTVAAPAIAPAVRERLEARGIRAADGGAFFPRLRRSRDEIPSYVLSWARDAVWGRNRRGIERALAGIDGTRVNVSMTTAIDADAWLIQSRPLGMALDAMRHSLNGGALRVGVTVGAPLIGPLDEHHLLEAGRRARVRYSTTQHVADWFDARGLPVDGVLPMYYRPTIQRSTESPARDSVLVYVGKETDSTALRMLLDTGIPVTMFGSKSAGWVVKSLQLQRYPHAHLLGHVTDQELSELYSNARFTAFPFTEEPFGLIPLESMACGTPILTYGQQGPGESVLNGRTGWFVNSPAEFARRAVELWNAGSPSRVMVAACLQRARSYHIDAVKAGWSSLFESASARSGGYATGRPGARSVSSAWAPTVSASRHLPGGTARPTSGPSGSPSVRPVLVAGPAPPPSDLSPRSPYARSGGFPGPSEDERVGWTVDDEPFLRALAEEDDARALIPSTPSRASGALPLVTTETSSPSSS
jgi:hypothetical protein